MDGTKTGARPLREEIWRHLKRMKELSLTEQISYVQVRVRGKIEVRMRKLTEIRKRAAIGCCIRLGRPLPVSLRSKYLIRLYARAAATYEPLPFAGPMALLIAKERGEKECDYWRSLAGGKLEFSRQPGNHMDLFSEEGVGGYAHQLRAWLEAAQSATD